MGHDQVVHAHPPFVRNSLRRSGGGAIPRWTGSILSFFLGSGYLILFHHLQGLFTRLSFMLRHSFFPLSHGI